MEEHYVDSIPSEAPAELPWFKKKKMWWNGICNAQQSTKMQAGGHWGIRDYAYLHPDRTWTLGHNILKECLYTELWVTALETNHI